jgi:hypothetical protein
MKKITALVLLMCSLSCHAEWQVFNEADDGTWYLDPTTQTTGTQAQVWTLFDHKQPVGAFGVRSVKTLVEADCKAGWLREISLVVFNSTMAQGSILRNTSPGTQKIYPPAGSAYDILAHKLCPDSSSR